MDHTTTFSQLTEVCVSCNRFSLVVSFHFNFNFLLKDVQFTAWHYIFAGVQFYGWAILCFAGTNFCDWEKLFFLAGNYFLLFAGSRVQLELQHFRFLIVEFNRNAGETTCRCKTR